MSRFIARVVAAAILWCGDAMAAEEPQPRVEIRAVYGGFPVELLREGKHLKEAGINAVFVGSGAVKPDLVAKAREEGVRLFAEFNTLHVASYLKEHADAAPVGADGAVCPPPHGWQGICPTHPGYRRSRMDAFRTLLAEHALDGVWLDYHHSHASWERADPVMPDTCFCDRCVAQFSRETGIGLLAGSRAEVAAVLLDRHRERWVQWRCDVLTDWVREFRAIRDKTRPAALLGTFHCPWSDTDFQGALRAKLAIDLKAQAAHVDVFSPMPYHARFAHPQDPAWIHRQVAWLGQHLGLTGAAHERQRIWPIVQLADWGEHVPPEMVATVLDYGAALPARGVIVFHWSGVRTDKDKVKRMTQRFAALAVEK